MMMIHRGAYAAAALATVLAAAGCESEPAQPASVEKWDAVAALPDIWSGVWSADRATTNAASRANPPKLTAEAVAHRDVERQASLDGRPLADKDNLCLPNGMPGLMAYGGLSFELLPGDGHIVMLGSGDNYQIRRIYTDGREHPEDPDPTYFGHSIGHWEDGTLIVDTVGMLPEVDVQGVPGDGETQIVERFWLSAPDTLSYQMVVTNPKVLEEPWTMDQVFTRQTAREWEILEGICLQSPHHTTLDGRQYFDLTLPEESSGP